MLPTNSNSNYQLQLLHFSDQEAGISAIEDAPRLSAVLNALKNQDGSDADTAPDYANTVVLSSGDAYIPGAFLNGSIQAYGGQGRADILIQNELGVQAIAFGNHEFDLGTRLVANLLNPAAATGRFPAYPGAAFPYLSGNLNFAPDGNLAPLVTADGQEASTIPGKIAASTIITVNGEKIGVVGVTTPILRSISSPGNVEVTPSPFGSTPTNAELDALAAVIQADVDSLLAANPDLNKVILMAHLQQIALEKALATRLKNVDIIIAGGSNTRLLDSNDVLRAGDTVQGEYPFFTTDADGKAIAVVNTDGNYKYVGRLVIDFDSNGNIVPESYDVNVSGAYATDDTGVAALNAQSLVDPEIQTIVNNISTVVASQDGAIFGKTDVFLNGTRNDVRTEETNFGNLSADANLATAKALDNTVTISIKNGGGIRDNIGFVTFPPGSTNPNDVLKLPPQANPLAGKEEGDISQLDIANSLSFNNGLTLVTVTAAQLLQVIEHAVAATAPGATPGQFAQVSGVQFSFDPDLPANNRVQSLAVVDDNGDVIDIVAANGELIGNSSRTFRLITLNFLASGGDNYPFPSFLAENPTLFNRVDLLGAAIAEPIGGVATFAAFGSEQDALAEYVASNFATTPYAIADTPASQDIRIQNLNLITNTAPNFSPVNAAINIAENTTFVIDLNATDVNGDTVKFNIIGDDAGLFTINSTTGVLSFISAPNFEAPVDANADNVYVVDAIASDGKGGNTIQTLNVTINNIGENNVNDSLLTTPNKDVINALSGNDTVTSTFANLKQQDTINGGAGRDTFVLTGGTTTDVLTVNLNSTTNQFNIPGTVIESFETIDFSGFVGRATITGTNQNETIIGGAGNDTIDGRDGNDVLTSGNGNDFLDGGLGADILNGGAGNDTIFGRFDNDVLNGDDGNDYLDGGLGADILNGGTGNDTIFGRFGNDVLNGDNGNDYLDGGLGADILNGGTGNDTIFAGLGADIITGGRGNDSLLLGADNSRDTVFYTRGDGTDIIRQFNRGVGRDLLSFSGINNIDVKIVGGSTQFTLSNGIAGDNDFAQGTLLVTLSDTSGFNSRNISNNIVGASFFFS